MTSPQIKILISLGAVSIVYAYVCQIRLSRKASAIKIWLKKERPDLWSDLNFIARTWNGGWPGLKLIYRRNVVRLPRFDEEYLQLKTLERKLLWGIFVGLLCIALISVGLRFWKWHW